MKIKNTKTDILLNIAAVACLAAVTLYLLVRWSQIPMTIPGHYTADGQIDSWAARTTLWQLPVLGWVLYVLITILEQLIMAYQIKKDPISKIPKVQLAFWLLVRLAMLICAGYSFIHGDTVMGFESIFCFIFTHLWDLFQIFGNGSFIEEVPPLSQTLLNIIIFIGIVFGSYLELFDKLAHFDDFMHLLSGFVCAAFGFDFARIIQRKKGPCAVTLAAIFGLMFAVTIAAGWEFYEFLMDTLHGTNLQLAKAGPETAMFDLAKYHGEYGYIGLVDTMTDMMMNVVGGIVGMIFMIVLRTKGDKKRGAKAKK